mmetsp:Transcript_18175/g.50612  ORF Transcript_18175/g.50612 Transcript_18175/m.50612 type:complete len:203 (-) Transcript_18175:545-1153(-)
MGSSGDRRHQTMQIIPTTRPNRPAPAIAPMVLGDIDRNRNRNRDPAFPFPLELAAAKAPGLPSSTPDGGFGFGSTLVASATFHESIRGWSVTRYPKASSASTRRARIVSSTTSLSVLESESSRRDRGFRLFSSSTIISARTTIVRLLNRPQARLPSVTESQVDWKSDFDSVSPMLLSLFSLVLLLFSAMVVSCIAFHASSSE